MQQVTIQKQDCHYFRVPCQNVFSLPLRSKLLTGLSLRNIMDMIFSIFSVLLKPWRKSRNKGWNTNIARELAIEILHK